MALYTTYTVRLSDNTVGEIRSSRLKHPGEPWVGEKIKVCFLDENGLPRTKTGLVAEVLESSDLL